MSDAIESLLAEGRTFPPPEEFKTRASIVSTEIHDEADVDFEGLLGAPGGRPPRLVRGVAHGPRLGPAVREVVRRRQAERLVQLPRPSRRGRPRRQGRVPLGRRARRHAHDHLRPAARRREPARQRAQGARRRARAIGSTSTSGWCRSCRWRSSPARGSARRTPWCSVGSPPTRCATASTTPRRRCSITGDGAWRRGSVVPLKETADVAVAELPDDREGARAAAHRARRPDDRRARHLVARPRTHPEDRLPARADGLPRTSSTSSTRPGRRASRRASCTPPVATSRRSLDAPARVRPPARRRRVLVHGRRRLGDRPLATSCTDRSRTAPRESSTRDAQPPRQRPAVADHREVQVTILYTAPTAIRTFMKWGDEYPDRTTCRRSGCSVRWASRSTPRRGCGTRRHRWWTVSDRGHVVADRDRRHPDHARSRVTSTKPGSATYPLPGIGAAVDAERREDIPPCHGRWATTPCIAGVEARSIPRGSRRDPRRSSPPGPRCCAGSGVTRSGTVTPTGRASRHAYFAGDGAKRDEDGYFWLLGGSTT